MKNKIILICTGIILSLMLALPAFAGINDPAGCYSNSVTMSLTAYRADGITPIAGGTVESGETIKYDVQLAFSSGIPGACSFVGGSVIITTPDGVHVNVTPPGGIPQITENNSLITDQASYVVSESDIDTVSGKLVATADYIGGISLTGNDDDASDSRQLKTPYQDRILDVMKTANPYLERDYHWTIEKTVAPSEIHIFDGDTAESLYEVSVTKTTGREEYSVSGIIEIFNPALYAAAEITGVDDSITGGIAAVVDCGVSFPYLLGPGQTLICGYYAVLPDGSARVNEAVVATSGDIDGNSATADIDFTGVVPTEVNPTITVTDTNPVGPWIFTDTDSATYVQKFDCEGVSYSAGHGMYTHPNTATIIQTGASDDASVIVNCYQLLVEKDAETFFERKYEWDLDKRASESSLTLASGEVYDVNYEVEVWVTGYTDMNWIVSGAIYITNPNPAKDAEIADVQDSLSGIEGVDCPASVVPAGGMMTCTYGPALLPDGQERLNEATAILQNYDYDSQGNSVADGTTAYTGSALVTFGDPGTEYDECVEVEDDMYGYLGVVCMSGAPHVFTYTETLGGYVECGLYEVPNIANLTTNDFQIHDMDNWLVTIDIPCDTGCTLTQGYWKTHSREGPAPYDDNWQNLGVDEEDTLFFLSEMTWYEVFWAPPKGNVYYNLAHQYMAAYLNVLNGASTEPEVDDALSNAATLFNTYTDEEVAEWKGNDHKEERQEFIGLAGILADYNEGSIGPGHCDEQVS